VKKKRAGVPLEENTNAQRKKKCDGAPAGELGASKGDVKGYQTLGGKKTKTNHSKDSMRGGSRVRGRRPFPGGKHNYLEN